MSIIGSFDPSVETYPSPSATGSINLIPDSSFELGTAAVTAVGDFDILRQAANSLSGVYSHRVTVDYTNSGTQALVRFPVASTIINPGTDTYRASAWVRVDVSSPLIGQQLGIGFYDTNGTPASAVTTGLSYVLVPGWQRISATVPYGGANDISGVQIGRLSSTDLASAGVFYVDSVMLSSGTTLRSWAPANAEPFYTNGQEWVATGSGTFQGLSITDGDLLTCTSSGWSLADDATWEVTAIPSGPGEALLERPIGTQGVPIGYGDWRYVVQILLPRDATARWGIAKWGESMWNGVAWYDLTTYVRGLTWTRGTTQFGGRPEVGVATLTLANPGYIFSPWNGLTSFQNSAVIDSDDNVSGGYLGPGTLMRVVCYSPSGETNPTIYPGVYDTGSLNSWVPQFSGVVESWTDQSFALGADSDVTVVLKETLSTMATVDELALVSPVGNDELPDERIQRLLDAAGWKYGDLISMAWSLSLSPSSKYNLQSTHQAGNRISEIYLTADSVGAVVRTDRSGRPVMYRVQAGGLGYAIQRGPDIDEVSSLSWEFTPSISAPYIADTPKTANDDEIILNDVSMSYVGGSVSQATDTASITQYGRRTYSRMDLICKEQDLIDFLIELTLSTRTNPLRLSTLSLHSEHEGAYPAIIGLDIGAYLDVFLPPLPGYTIEAPACFISGYTHNVTPLNAGAIIWTTDITFGVQSPIEILEI